MKAIFNHFNSLGGLYNVSQENLLDTRIFNDEIKLIEEYYTYLFVNIRVITYLCDGNFV